MVKLEQVRLDSFDIRPVMLIFSARGEEDEIEIRNVSAAARNNRSG